MNIEPHGIEHVDWAVLVELEAENAELIAENAKLRDRLRHAETRLTAIRAVIEAGRR